LNLGAKGYKIINRIGRYWLRQIILWLPADTKYLGGELCSWRSSTRKERL
jgi:hypothetical protein